MHLEICYEFFEFNRILLPKNVSFYCWWGGGESGNMVAAIKNESQRRIFHTNAKKLKLSRRYTEMKVQTNVKNIIWEKRRFLVRYHLLNLFSPFNKFFELLTRPPSLVETLIFEFPFLLPSPRSHLRTVNNVCSGLDIVLYFIVVLYLPILAHCIHSFGSFAAVWPLGVKNEIKCENKKAFFFFFLYELSCSFLPLLGIQPY